MITDNLEKVKNALIQDEIVAIPTETVYGLAGNIYSEIAIQKIFTVKKRPFFNPLIVHLKSVDCLDTVAKNIPEIAWKIASRFWPGPLTLVLDKKAHISELITGGKSTVAVRVPNHHKTLALLNSIDFPLAAPSANIFKTLSPTCAKHVSDAFGDEMLILEGNECTIGLESTIIGFDGQTPIVYRLGAIEIEEIESITGKVKWATTENSNPNAPGMLTQHYSPNTHLIVTSDLQKAITNYSYLKIGVLEFTPQIEETQVVKIQTLSKIGDLREAASNFYNALHQLDRCDLEVIIAEEMPNVGLGKTINDRLKRAIANNQIE
jgi:L-threonylcarbamoyladenylate synthase